MITIIAAVTADRLALGRSGELLYRLSPDMRHFKETTMGHPVIMGRKTFESFPNGPLPGRRNIVVSRNEAYSPEGAKVFRSLDDALAAVDGQDAFVIGGGEIYRQSFDRADRLLLTVIDAPTPADADTFFPEIDPGKWREEWKSEKNTDPKTSIPYQFICLSRI